jgi:hypothetical protein
MSGVDIAGLLSEWRKAMDGVTPGPWNPSRFGMQVLTGDSWATVCTFHDKNGGDGKWNDHRLASWEDGRGASLETSNADWVARCSPSGISALLDALSEATRQRDEALAALKGAREALEPFSEVAETEEEVGRDDPDDDRILIVQTHGCQLAELTVEHFRRAKSVLENSKAPIADATNNPPSDPGTGQREAGV